MSKNTLEIKGNKEGFILNTRDMESVPEIILELDLKIKENPLFLLGINFLDISSDVLTDNDKMILKIFLFEKYGISFKEDLKKNEIKIIKENDYKNTKFLKSDHDVFLETKFISDTVRSGINIEFDGHIVVIGDVNPGAKVVARGNIIVLGYLRGIAHAGANGEISSFIIAQKMAPIQLRISDSIAIAPNTENIVDDSLIAKIIDNNIMVESYIKR